MAIDTRTFRSTVKPDFIKAVLFKGTAVAAAGVLLMTLGALFLSPVLLAQWGLPLFLFCMILIAVGLLPHRRLLRLEKKPNEIIVIGDTEIQYWSSGKKILTIPQQKIQTLTYVETKTCYGICIQFDPHCPQKVIVHDKSRKISHKNCDLFFPFFSERVCRELQDLQDNRALAL